MRATRADQPVEERAVITRRNMAAIRAAEQVAWQRLHIVATGRSGMATYRGALQTWQTARYDLDRALVPRSAPSALRRRRPAHHALPIARTPPGAVAQPERHRHLCAFPP